VARPRSEDKRNAILAAATEVFADRGLGAPTSAVSSVAGVAEGTLFTYFATKDDLVNALYREIKLELADALMSGFPRKKSVRVRMKHIWDAYVNWGVANPLPRRVLSQLEVSDRLTEESKEAGRAPFSEVFRMVEDASAQRLFHDMPEELGAAAMQSLAEATMNLSASNPARADQYRESGFGIFWSGVTKRK
jgi:AcrR family transcriptional regulator